MLKNGRSAEKDTSVDRRMVTRAAKINSEIRISEPRSATQIVVSTSVLSTAVRSVNHCSNSSSTQIAKIQDTSVDCSSVLRTALPASVSKSPNQEKSVLCHLLLCCVFNI
ncbi:hypothetical protein RND71_017729 [Anisodus tanguticus]|uniref:Uncharacterized protein n=1 Tax=Anisodus tanguticus TaxID=243964 RepID=A0AAE1S2S9_9SOLA|nr:hypothetical protein RND71_017729 [Anisodus tanguticus]